MSETRLAVLDRTHHTTSTLVVGCGVFLLAMLALVVPAAAQEVDGAALTVKRVYNLVPPTDSTDPAVGTLRRAELETYGPDGRRLRVEWRDADDVVTLAFMELYERDDRPIGAVYFEGGDLAPYLERNAYRAGDAPGTTIKQVSYFRADGVVTAINEFVLGADGRELERRYRNAAGEPTGSDAIRYDGLNQAGYTYRSADGTRQVEYVYRVATVDARGHWTSRTVERNGEPRLFETREIAYRQP